MRLGSSSAGDRHTAHHESQMQCDDAAGAAPDSYRLSSVGMIDHALVPTANLVRYPEAIPPADRYQVPSAEQREHKGRPPSLGIRC
jgi:hypothetical protein